MATWAGAMVERARDVTPAWAPCVAVVRRHTRARLGLLCAPDTAVSRPPMHQAGASAGGATQAAWRTSAPTEPDPLLLRMPAEESRRCHRIFAGIT
jgi:hypothetical protein